MEVPTIDETENFKVSGFGVVEYSYTGRYSKYYSVF